MDTASSADRLFPDRNAGFPTSLEELLYEDNKHITTVAFNRKGSLLAAGCKCGTVLIWDMGTRGVVQELKPAPRPAPPGPARRRWPHLLRRARTGRRQRGRAEGRPMGPGAGRQTTFSA